MQDMIERDLPTPEARELMQQVRDLVACELAPEASAGEADRRFPREKLAMLGEMGVLGLIYPKEYGGGAQPFSVYLQIVEELARGWLTVAESVAVHTLACLPMAQFGTQEQRGEWLPHMVGGKTIGAYCLTEPEAGSDPASLQSHAVRDGDVYIANGTKAWITHSGVADFYNLMVRTGEPGPRGISCLFTPADTPGLTSGERELLMGLRGSPVGQVLVHDVVVPVDRRVGEEGQGFGIAMAALDGGRLGIAACSIGLAQAAFELALEYATERRQFGQQIINFQGVSFMLADMATSIAAGRSLYLDAARRRDRGEPHTVQASMAKMFCSDVAMSVTTNAVQILGAAGYSEKHPAERYMREAKILQIFEGTNQIQRVVVAKGLERLARGS